jgi:hypothetical protein
MADLSPQTRRYLIAMLAGTLVLLSIDLFLPLSLDNEIYQSMAMDLFRFGRLPYLGSWDQNFPGIVYIHWLSIVIFGKSVLGFRVFDLTLHLSMAWMLFSLLCRWIAPSTACLAVLLYILHYISEGDAMAGERDEFAVLFLLVGTVLLFAATGNVTRQWPVRYLAGFGAGIALTLIFTIRPTYGTFVLAGLAFVFLSPENRTGLAASFIAGVCCILSALLIPYVMRPGGIEQFYLSTVRYNIEIYGAIREPFAIQIRKLFLIPGLIGVLLALRPSFRRAPRVRRLWQTIHTPRSRERWLFLGYVLSGLISLFVMGKYLPYHFAPILLLLMPFAALGIESIIAAIPRRTLQGVAIALLVLYSILGVYPLFLLRSIAHNIRNGQTVVMARYEMVSEEGFRGNVEESVAEYIDKTSPRGERVECATLTAGIRWRTPRECMTRFTTFYPLSLCAPNGGHPDFQQVWRKEYVDSLRFAKPYYLVIGNGPTKDTNWLRKPPSQSIHEIEGFDSLVMPLYRFDTILGGYTILKRRD